jgi:hypothetical protein
MSQLQPATTRGVLRKSNVFSGNAAIAETCLLASSSPGCFSSHFHWLNFPNTGGWWHCQAYPGQGQRLG